MYDFVYELPHQHPFSGGVNHTLKVAIAHGAHVRFRELLPEFPEPVLPVSWSVGDRDESFPECRFVVTYSNSLNPEELSYLPQVHGIVGAWMLSWGMAPKEEWEVARNVGVVMTSTLRTRRMIAEDMGIPSVPVGFVFDPITADYLHPQGTKQSCIALNYHPRKEKKYRTAAEVADRLCDEGLATQVVSFGVSRRYEDAYKPKMLTKHVPDADIGWIRAMFQQSSLFLMPSVTEGLNRTTAEATLCGCPAVLCDGAVGELYHHGGNCLIVPKYDQEALYEAGRAILCGDVDTSNWERDMRSCVEGRTADKVAANIEKTMMGACGHSTRWSIAPQTPNSTQPVASIIIPVHNQKEKLQACVESIERATEAPYALILVDDGSDEDTKAYCERLVIAGRAYTVIRFKEPRGFTGACNEGLFHAPESEYYILLNSDTMIGTHGWLRRLQKVGRIDRPKAGLFGPVSNRAGMQSLLGERGGEVLPEMSLKRLTSLVDRFTRHQYPLSTLIHGFCYIIRRECYEDLGPLDHKTFPHYGSEDDYSLRAREAGWEGCVLDDVFVYHVGSASYSRTGRKPLADASQKALRGKWGDGVVDECVREGAKVVEYLRAEMIRGFKEEIGI